MGFERASKKQSRLRLSLIGPSGSGKTYSALSIAQHLGGKVAVIDTEHGSASKYADEFAFDVMEPASFSPQQYIDAIHEAENAGYDVLIIDSLSHAWMGKDGALEQVDRAAKRSQSNNTFAAWREVTPLHNALVETMVQSRCHLIVTMRAKTEYVMETNDKGKQVPRKVGMAPIQRDGLEYEFDVVADMNLSNEFMVSKTRCKALNGAVIQYPGKQVADTLKQWLTDGAPAPVLPPETAAQPPTAALAPADGARMTKDDFKTLTDLCELCGLTADAFKAHLKGLGYTRSGEIPARLYETLKAWIKNGGTNEKPPASDTEQTTLSDLAPAGAVQ